ncbi:MAG: hypothetical protein IMW89_06665 [Ktedonobacteraceae bacterium]|nr:hypothetical protein [Ktedonobacteraceae bacterium]
MARSLDTNNISSKEQMISAFDAAYNRLLVAATAAAERGVVLPQGEWGPREVLAHVAGWAAQATTRIPQVIAGSLPVVYIDEAQHDAVDDAFNAAFIALVGGQSFAQVSATFQQTHHAFVDMLKAQDERHFVPGSYLYERMLAVVHHHLQHAQELEERA